MGKFAGIFAAASEHEIARESLVLLGEGVLRRDSATLNSPVRMSTIMQADISKRERPTGSIESHRRESSDLRVNEWRMQTSAGSVVEEGGTLSAAAPRRSVSSEQSGMAGGPPPSYASPLRPPFLSPLQPVPKTPQRFGGVPFSASCNDLGTRPAEKPEAIRITDANGNAIQFKRAPANRMSMHSAPDMTATRAEGVTPAPPMPAKYETHAMRSQAASKRAYEILAAQKKRRDEGERRQWEQIGGHGNTKAGSQAGPDPFM